MKKEVIKKSEESIKKLEKGATEFKTFISKGNVVDMAVGVIIGSAFGKIVTSLVNDVLMPLIGVILGGLDFSNLNINPWYDKNTKFEGEVNGSWDRLDCEYGRILTKNGVYTCPFLANDYRGRCGSSLQDYTKRSSLETSFCNTCIKSKGILSGKTAGCLRLRGFLSPAIK